MGTVVQLKNRINNSYSELKNSVEDKLVLVEEKIRSRLSSKISLVDEMTNYHLRSGGKRIRALLTLGAAESPLTVSSSKLPRNGVNVPDQESSTSDCSLSASDVEPAFVEASSKLGGSSICQIFRKGLLEFQFVQVLLLLEQQSYLP